MYLNSVIAYSIFKKNKWYITVVIIFFYYYYYYLLRSKQGVTDDDDDVKYYLNEGTYTLSAVVWNPYQSEIYIDAIRIARDNKLDVLADISSLPTSFCIAPPSS